MSTHATPPRFNWAVDTMCIQPTSFVLEIGCGVGFLASGIAPKLTSGRLVAIDRSEKMIQTAEARNSAFVSSRIARFEILSFEMFSAPQSHFDIVVAFNLSLMYNGNTAVFDKLKTIMKDDASLFVFYQPPGNSHMKISSLIEERVKQNRFHVCSVLVNELISPPIVCVQARKTDG